MQKLFAVTLILALSTVAFGYEYGYCQLQPTSNNPGLFGYIQFQTSATTGSIDMYVNVGGITVNTGIAHGIHIHEFGDLKDTGSALSVGTHYSPTGTAHGCPDAGSANWHDGDTGNWNVSATGTIVGNKTLTLPKLSGVNSIIGRAVVVHSSTDDCATTGSSLTRLGFCVIGIGNPSYVGRSGNNATNDATSIPIAVCDLQPIGGSGVSGRVWLTPVSGGVTVDAIITGLTGTHGFHIHQYGDLSLNDTGNSTGGHYNPTNNNHGIPPYEDRHLGDMGNLYYSINSSTIGYSYTFTSTGGNAPLISLTGTNNVIGRAIVVHSAADNCSQPTGASGSRLAYCVIGIGNTTTTSNINQFSVPTTQNDSNCIAPSPSATPSPAAGTSASPSPAGTSASPSPAGASASPSPAGTSASPSASSTPALPSASSSPGSDSLAAEMVPCFVAIGTLVLASIF